MTQMQHVWSTWPQPDLDSVGILCKGHCLASIVPLGKDSFLLVSIFLEKIKRCLWLSYTVERQGALFSLWESENVSRGPALSFQRKVRIFPQSFLWLCFPEDVSSYLVSHEESPEVPYLPEFCAFHPPPLEKMMMESRWMVLMIQKEERDLGQKRQKS